MGRAVITDDPDVQEAIDKLIAVHGSMKGAISDYLNKHLTDGQTFTSKQIADDLGITRGMVTGAMAQYRSKIYEIVKPNRTTYQMVRIDHSPMQSSAELPSHLAEVPCYILRSYNDGAHLIWLKGEILVAKPFDPQLIELQD